MLSRHEEFAKFLMDEKDPVRAAFFAHGKEHAQELSLTRYVDGSLTSESGMQDVVKNLFYFADLQQRYSEICASVVVGSRAGTDIDMLTLAPLIKCQLADFLDWVLILVCSEYLQRDGSLRSELKKIFEEQGLLKNANKDAKESHAHAGCNDATNFVRDKMVHGLAALIIGVITVQVHQGSSVNQDVLPLISRELKITQDKINVALDKFVEARRLGEGAKLKDRANEHVQAYEAQQKRIEILRQIFKSDKATVESIIASPIFVGSKSMGEYFHKTGTQLYTQICDAIAKESKHDKAELSTEIAESRKYITEQLLLMRGQECRKFDNKKVVAKFKEIIKKAQLQGDSQKKVQGLLENFTKFVDTVFLKIRPHLAWGKSVMSSGSPSSAAPRLSTMPKPLGFVRSPDKGSTLPAKTEQKADGVKPAAPVKPSKAS